MGGQDWPAEPFETYQSHLHAVAYRMLGTRPDAEDAVQEAWIRFSRSDTSSVDNLGGWLTTVLSRVCLDMLRSRASRREEPQARQPGAAATPAAGHDPELDLLLADSIGPALLVVLDTLTPPERLAFVLHDLFDVPFADIGPILDRSPGAAKQLASRARRKVREAQPASQTDASRQRAVVRAFLAASRNGDFDALLELLDPGAVVRADATAVQFGALREVRGAAAVAESFTARAYAVLQPALIDGAAGAVWADAGIPRAVFAITITGATITAIDILASPEVIQHLDITVLND